MLIRPGKIGKLGVISKGISSIVKILKGVSSLIIQNAIKNSLKYLKLFGGTEQLSEIYLDTVTLSGGCEQRNLPVGYTEYDGLIGDGTAYIDLNCTLDQNDEIELEFTMPATAVNSINIFGYKNSASSQAITAMISSTSNQFIGDFNNSDYIPYRLLTSVSTSTRYKLISNKTGRYLYQDSTLVGSNTTACPNTILTGNAYLFNIGGTPVYTNKFLGTIHRCLIKGKRDVVPCSNGTAYGMYDKLNGVFYPNANTEGSFTVGNVVIPSPTTPMDIVSNNGAIKYNNNLLNSNTNVINKCINDTGVIGDNEGSFYSALIPAKPNTEYTFYRDFGAGSYPRIHAYDSNGDWIAMIVKGETIQSLIVSGTTTATTAFIRVTAKMASNARVYLTDYQYNAIYTDGTQEIVTDSLGNTATAEMLLSVGDYKDTQEVLSGGVTRNIGIKVLDGTEDWKRASGAPIRFYLELPNGSYNISGAFTPYCTHCQGCLSANGSQSTVGGVTDGVGFWYHNVKPKFYELYLRLGSVSSITNVTTLKQYLANQYANGTPIIVVYVLETPTIESVSGQFLSKSPVTQTAGSISDLPITITESAYTIPTPQQPLPINCNNGVVKVSPNLFNFNTITSLTITIPVENNQTYTWSFDKENYNFRWDSSKVWGVDSNGNTVTDGIAIINTGDSYMTADYYTFTVVNSSVVAIRTVFRDDSMPATVDNIKASKMMFQKGTQRTTYYPYGQIYVDGTTETVEVTGKNLFDVNTMLVENKAIRAGNTSEQNPLGSEMSNDNWSCSTYIKVLPNTTYTYTIPRTVAAGAAGMVFYANTTVESAILGLTQSSLLTRNFKTPNGCNYLRFSWVNSVGRNGGVQLEQGSTATTYEPYYYGGSATAEILLKVGTYQDIQSVLDGKVTRKVGIKVFDGTEVFIKPNNGYAFQILNALGQTSGVGYCSHFKTSPASDEYIQFGASANKYVYFRGTDSSFPTVNDFKAWLSDQYNSGNPVIVVYPLATATTEIVTPQPLTIQAGTNIIEITQASMDDLELEIKYLQKK